MQIKAKAGFVEVFGSVVFVFGLGCGCSGVRKEQSSKIAFPRLFRSCVVDRV